MKRSFPARLCGWLIAVSLFGGTFVQAQKLQPAPWNDPAVVWLTPAAAQTKLQAELQILQPQLSGLTPGTAPHTDLLRRIIFFKSMLRAVAADTPVPQAIDSVLPEAASMGSQYEQNFTSEAALRALYEEALALLTD